MEFATFLSAVKGKKRTDQYLILSALFFLDAHKSPITSSEVQKLLSLRLKKKTPKNIPDALRKYEAYVETGYTLTARGLTNATELLKKMVEGKNQIK